MKKPFIFRQCQLFMTLIDQIIIVCCNNIIGRILCSMNTDGKKNIGTIENRIGLGKPKIKNKKKIDY